MWVWKPYMLTRLPSLTHSVYLYYRKWRKSLRWANHQVIFVYKSAYVYICWMTCNVIVYALWSISEHDIPTFDYEMKSYFYMKCFDKYLFYHVLFLGTNSASLLKLKGFTLKMFKKHKWNRSFLAEILGMSQLVSEH